MPVTILIRLLRFNKFDFIWLLFLGIDATSVLANEEANANKGQSVIDVDSDDDVGDVSKVIEDIREHSILDFLICSLNSFYFDHIYLHGIIFLHMLPQQPFL